METLQRYALSSVITFIATFLTSFLPQIDLIVNSQSDMNTALLWSALAGAAVVSVRTATKALIESMVKNFSTLSK